jgi:Asp-tRNA(Asn)/Glu-tRNA(Gln) amidotransferase A subunit family amidase
METGVAKPVMLAGIEGGKMSTGVMGSLFEGRLSAEPLAATTEYSYGVSYWAVVSRYSLPSAVPMCAVSLSPARRRVHARTTTPEFCCAPVTWTKLWGVTRNPWNLAYSPGGSSGGSAAALAAGTATLATGSDIGGSIRIPSSFCGVTGFKPPYGRVPEVPPFNLDHYCHEGPMARSVADCALLENVIAGPHPSDVVSLRPKLEIPFPLEPVAGLRIALSPDLGCFTVDPDVAANTLAAAERLRDAGAVVTEVSLPWRRADIARAARIHFGMIFGPSVRHCTRSTATS